MKIDKKNNAKLIKWIYFIPLLSIVVIVVSIATFFVYKEKQVYKSDIDTYKIKLLKLKKLEVEDRITKLSEQIEYNKKILIDESKQNVKNLVDFAYKTIEDIYNANQVFGKEYTINIIKNRLRNLRFFNDLSGYFYMYKMDGTCLLLPTNPELEGKNLLNIKDAVGTKIIKKAINILKRKDKAFDSWYWYKPGKKTMEKKIGYFRWFKPLDIYIGSAFYVEDVIEKAKKIALKIIRNYRYADKGYIFAYDYNGTTLSHIKKDLIGKNRINLFFDNRHIVKEIITGARINKEGFFVSYMTSYDPISHKPSRKISYIKNIPEFGFVIGTGFYVSDIRKLALKRYAFLKQDLDRIIRTIVIISLIMIILLGAVMIMIANKIKQILQSYEEDLLKQYNKIISQKKVFQLLFEKSKDGIFLDDEEKFLDCNEASVKMFGAKNKDELLKYNVVSLSPKFQLDGSLSEEKMNFIFDEAKREGVYRGEWLAKKLNGITFWLDIVISAIEIQDKMLFYTVLRDISQRKKIEKELKENEAKLVYRARHDALTNLPNRFMFGEIIIHEILKAKRENSKIAILFMDFDGFKNINDFYGHDIGDELLIQATKRLKEEIRQSDYLFRFGGDEFVFLLSGFHDENDIVKIAEKLNNTFSLPFSIRGHLLKIGISIGISVFPDDGTTSEELLRNADIAMYIAKEREKNRYVFYEEKMYERIMQRHTVEEDLKKAIENDEFLVYYQPQIDIKNQKVIGLEALVRWRKRNRIISPGEFISIASECNLINDIGNLVMNKAIKFAANLPSLFPDIQRVSINLDDKQLKDHNILDTIKNYLKIHNCNPALIEFEITEGFVMNDIKNSYQLLKNIRNLGCSVSIDDFGTGYSSLAYIKKLPLDVIKIDQSFIKDIPGFFEDEAIVSTIIELGKGLNLRIIAEGIENPKQEKFLFDKGCHIIQGYLYSKPLSQKEITVFLKNFCRKKERA